MTEKRAIIHHMTWGKPVMVDRYTYGKFKEKNDALLINYKYGDSYMFEIIRLKRSR